MAVFYYIFCAQTRLEGNYFILLHPSKHWRLAAFLFYQGKSYWRAGDLDQGINLEWPIKELIACHIKFIHNVITHTFYSIQNAKQTLAGNHRNQYKGLNLYWCQSRSMQILITNVKI